MVSSLLIAAHRPLSSVVSHLSSVICPPSTVICPPSHCLPHILLAPAPEIPKMLSLFRPSGCLGQGKR